MSNSEQKEIVRLALEGEKNIAKYTEKRLELQSAQFHKAPKEPTITISISCEKKEYPPIIPQIKFNWIAAILPCFIFTFIWIPVYYFVIHKKMEKKEIERIKNSAEYQNQCAAIDSEFERKKQEADALNEAKMQEYITKMQEYKTEILPKYQKELDEWETQRNAAIEELLNNWNIAKYDLKEHYDKTEIIPIHYRDVKILQHIYSTMSSSNYDIEAAMKIYDRYEQKQINKARLREGERANQLAAQQAYQAQQQAYYAQQQAYQQEEESSSGGGFLSGMLQTAAGVAVGNKLSQGKPNDGSGKPHLLGSAGCNRNKSMTSTCTGCPHSLNCADHHYF